MPLLIKIEKCRNLRTKCHTILEWKVSPNPIFSITFFVFSIWTKPRGGRKVEHLEVRLPPHNLNPPKMTLPILCVKAQSLVTEDVSLNVVPQQNET